MNLIHVTEEKAPVSVLNRVKGLFTLRGLSHYWELVCSLPKTLAFNCRYFPFRIALRLPVFVSHRVLLKKLSGRVELGRVKTGIVRIGFGSIPLFDSGKVRSVLIINGRIVFKGAAEIGPGCQIGVEGDLVCGDRFAVTGYSLIATEKSITFGNNVLISWDVLVSDHDWHDICDEDGNVLNAAKPVVIGNNVWICCKALVLKGTTIRDGVVVAAGATVTGDCDASNAIIGSDARLRVLKRNVVWRR